MTQFQLSAIAPDGSGVEVKFQRLSDRWAHTIAAVMGERLMPLLASAEGGPDDDWPPCPPLQEVDMQQESGQRLLFAVGAAGSARWSLSVESDPAHGRLIFDAACRHSVSPGQLGSTYRTMIAGQRGRSLHDVLLPAEPAVAVAALAAGESEPADVEITPSGLAIVPAANDFTGPASIRWRYAVGLAAPTESA